MTLPIQEAPFVPQPGQHDYTHALRAPVINCIVWQQDWMLLVQRHTSMRFYPGYWNGISGFLDDNKSVQEKAQEELREELGIQSTDILSIEEGEVFEQEEPKYKKIWIVHPVFVTVHAPSIRLDREASDAKWLTYKDVKNFKLLPGFEKVLEAFFDAKGKRLQSS